MVGDLHKPLSIKGIVHLYAFSLWKTNEDIFQK